MRHRAAWVGAGGLILVLATSRQTMAGETRFLDDCLANDATARLRIEACSFALEAENLADAQRVRALTHRASGYAALKKPIQATADLEAAKKLAPDDAEVTAALADVSHFIGGKQDAAIAGYQALLAKNPNDMDTLIKMGMAYVELKDNAGALATFSKALEIDPNNVTALIFRSSILSQTYKFDSAIKDLDRAVAVAPKNVMAHDWRGQVELEDGKFDLAIADFDFAIATKPRGLRRFRGAAKYGSGDFAGAVADFEFDLANNPDLEHLKIWRYLAEQRAGGGSVDELSVAAEQLAGRWPADLLRFTAGARTADQALAAAKSGDPALQQVRESQTHFVIGELAMLSGNKAAARDQFQICQQHGFLFAQISPSENPKSLLPADNVIEYSIARARLKELSQ